MDAPMHRVLVQTVRDGQRRSESCEFAKTWQPLHVDTGTISL